MIRRSHYCFLLFIIFIIFRVTELICWLSLAAREMVIFRRDRWWSHELFFFTMMPRDMLSELFTTPRLRHAFRLPWLPVFIIIFTPTHDGQRYGCHCLPVISRLFLAYAASRHYFHYHITFTGAAAALFSPLSHGDVIAYFLPASFPAVIYLWDISLLLRVRDIFIQEISFSDIIIMMIVICRRLADGYTPIWLFPESYIE